MLQFTNFYQQCFQDFLRSQQMIKTDEELDLEKTKYLSTNLFKEISQKRASKAQQNFLFYLDQMIWTETREHIDDPDFNVDIKKEIIQGLHLKNNVFGTYDKTIKILKPLIAEINKSQNRPARILELGSGIGKLTQAVYQKIKKTPLQIEMTGSDIIPEYVKTAKAEALKKNIKIDFLLIDACHLDRLMPNSYDIIFTLHSMHHFLPEQLSMIMSGSEKVATKAFVGIDGYRGIGNLLFMMILGAGASLCKLDSSFFHDSLISGRRMYSAKQLEIMAKIGCPQSTVIAENFMPGLSVIKILVNK